jgi:hypothetical protein
MTGDSPNTREPRYCQQWHPCNFNDWLISTRSTSGLKVTLTGPSCLERLQYHSTIELWNAYNNETCFTTSNLRMFHGNAGNEVGQFGTWKICVQQIGKWGKLIGCTICMLQTVTHLKINLSIIFFSNEEFGEFFQNFITIRYLTNHHHSSTTCGGNSMSNLYSFGHPPRGNTGRKQQDAQDLFKLQQTPNLCELYIELYNMQQQSSHVQNKLHDV